MMVKKIVRGFIIIVFGLTLYRCTTMQSIGKTPPEVGSEAVTTSPFLSEFEDIPIPSELKKDLDKSFIYETSSIKTAVLYYDSFPGYIDHSSLIIYFKNNMGAQGWQLIDLYNYKDATMSFEKGNRRCQITISDKFLKTTVVVKVGQLSQSEPDKEHKQ